MLAPPWDTLVADHGKLMHFLLREPDHNGFAHLHPVRRDARLFENVLPCCRMFTSFTPKLRTKMDCQTLTAKLALPASRPRPPGRVKQAQ